MAFAYTHTKLISLQRSYIVIINYRGVGVTRSIIGIIIYTEHSSVCGCPSAAEEREA